nr:NAD-dependent epimerase/dehydratase family protein [Escherichia coli]
MPDCIIHAAGLVGGIHANISRPFDFLKKKNLQMGLNLVSAAKKKIGIKKVLNLGSSCMYPKKF